MRISDWSSDVCSSDLPSLPVTFLPPTGAAMVRGSRLQAESKGQPECHPHWQGPTQMCEKRQSPAQAPRWSSSNRAQRRIIPSGAARSEEHTSELQSLMSITYAVFCLKKKTTLT